MSDLNEKLKILLAASQVKRYHNTSVEPQTVAAHSWGVATLAMLMTEAVVPESRLAILIACLLHDVAEAATGDIPAPTKRVLSPVARQEFDNYESLVMQSVGLELPSLNEHQIRILKICDALDGLQYCMLQNKMGNRIARTIIHKWESYLTSFEPFLPYEQAVVDAVKNHEIDYYTIPGDMKV